MTVLSEPALAKKTYSRAKSCYQNQYVETYHPGTREKPGYVSSREERVERPCLKTLHFHGRRSHKHREGHHAHNHRDHPPTRSEERSVVAVPNSEDNIPVWREASLGGGSWWSLGRRSCQKGQLDLVDSCRSCWRCLRWMSGRWRLSLYRVHTKRWLEKPAVAVQTNAPVSYTHLTLPTNREV